jgi:hypothetical protein
MRIVHVDDVPLMRGLEHRGGTFHARTLAEGQPGTADNFKFSLSRLGTDYSRPRHRHNFDQFRYMIDGESDYGDGALKPGMHGVPGKRSMDAYQAIWEHVHHRAMAYPKARYDAPVFMDSANYSWVPVKGESGVCEKLFGVWTERRTEAGLIRLDADAHYEVRGRGLYLLLSGAGECEGKPLKQHSTLFLDYGERATLRASEEAEFLHYGLPDFSESAASLSRSANEMQPAQ